MKKITTLWSVLVISLTFASCEKTELPAPAPETQNGSQFKKTSAGGGGNTGGQTATATYGGRATGIDATIWDFQNPIVTSNQATFADTYFLPASGGAVTKSELQATIQGSLTANTVNASITGQGNSTQTEASVADVQITTGGHTISATNLQATATAGCGAVLSGTSQVGSLVVNGQTITVTGAPNQAIYLANGGMILINERSTSKKGTPGITLTALHIIIPNAADIKIAAARADIKC